jgi:hypothetical protein
MQKACACLVAPDALFCAFADPRMRADLTDRPVASRLVKDEVKARKHGGGLPIPEGRSPTPGDGR